MFIGGSTGSTSGGIKIGRHLIFLKNIKRILLQLNNSKMVVPVRYNGKIISSESNSRVLGFIALYLIVFAFSSLLLIITGLDLQTSAGATATCMAGIGPGLGSVGPIANFAHLPVISKYILSATMILGRLEIFTIFVLFSPSFWRS